MDQRKLAFSKSSLLDSHVTLLLKELTAWLCEKHFRGESWTAEKTGRKLMETVPEHARRPVLGQDFKWR